MSFIRASTCFCLVFGWIFTAGCTDRDRPNVLLITMDTTRADHIGAYGHEEIDTPHIDAMAQTGVRYENAFSPVPVTLPAHTSIMTGTYPVYHGVRENGGFYVSPGALTAAEVLAAEGYSTGAFVGAFPLDSQTGIDQGFQHFNDYYPSSLESGKHPLLRRFFDERPASEVTQAAIEWLAGMAESPFFLWAHYFDPHQPLTPPTAFRHRYASAYDAEIASVDAAIGELLSHLEERGWLRNTLVIITADHGEGLGEHGEATHALLVYSSTLRVPLIVRDPRRAAAVVTAPVTTVDIFATILDRLGLHIPGHNQGIPLPANDSEADQDRAIYSESLFGRLIYGWSPIERITKGSDVLIRGPESVRLYDRRDDRDELADVAGARPQELAGLIDELEAERELQAWGGNRFSRGEDLSQADQSALREAIARLESLGYVGSAVHTGDLDDRIDPDRPDPLLMMNLFDLHNEGSSLIDAGRYDIATSVLARAHALDPGNPAVLTALAQAQMGRGDLQSTRITLEDLLNLQQNDLRTLLLLARLLALQGELEDAIGMLRAAIAIDANDVSTRLILAHLLEDDQQIGEAESAYEALLAIDPGNALGLNGLATLVYRRGDSERAVDLLQSVLDQQPFFPPAWLNLGVVEFGRGNISRALYAAERALELRPTYPQALALRQRIHEQPAE